MRSLPAVVALVVLAGSFASCTSAPDPGTEPAKRAERKKANARNADEKGEDDVVAPEAPSSNRLRNADLALQHLADLAQTVALATRPGDDRLYIAQRYGFIRVLRNGKLDRKPLLDISSRIRLEAATGLLGLTFSPDGGHMYICYADKRGDTRIVRYTLTGERLVAGSARKILEVKLPTLAHRGGHIAFGPDGNLWFGLGDGSLLYEGVKTGGDPRDKAQSLDSLYGKLIRIDPVAQGAQPYEIPVGNPFRDRNNARPEIYAYGLRNPWRFSFDRATGDLWIGDVGQYILEEIDFLKWRRHPGANFGWNRLEGTRPFHGKAPANAIPPLAQYNHDDGRCVVVGGYVYRGSEIRDLHGAYVFGDFCDGKVRALIRRPGGAVTEPVDLGLQVDRLISFGEDEDGELYALSLESGVYRIVEDSDREGT